MSSFYNFYNFISVFILKEVWFIGVNDYTEISGGGREKF